MTSQLILNLEGTINDLNTWATRKMNEEIRTKFFGAIEDLQEVLELIKEEQDEFKQDQCVFKQDEDYVGEGNPDPDDRDSRRGDPIIEGNINRTIDAFPIEQVFEDFYHDDHIKIHGVKIETDEQGGKHFFIDVEFLEGSDNFIFNQCVFNQKKTSRLVSIPIRLIDVCGSLNDLKPEELKEVKDTIESLKGFKIFNQMPKIPKSLIKHMDQASCDCVEKHPDLHDHPFLCENVYWTPHQDQNSYTLHTHTIAGVDYPSEADINTTHNLKKKNLCIINTIDKTLSCYNGKDFKVKNQIAI